MARIRGLAKLDKHNPCKVVWNQYVAQTVGMFGQMAALETAFGNCTSYRPRPLNPTRSR